MDLDLDPTTNGSLRSPVDDPRVQQALSRKHSNKAVVLLPLDDNSIAIFDRSFALYAIVDEAISHDYLSSLSNLFFNKLANRTAEARLYGEPDDRSLAKDLKNGRKPPQTPRPTQPPGVAVEIDLS